MQTVISSCTSYLPWVIRALHNHNFTYYEFHQVGNLGRSRTAK